MKHAVARRDILDPLTRSLRKKGFEDVTTRRGARDQTFHIDGKHVIGRGTVSLHAVDDAELREIHRDVYLLDRMKNKAKIHTAYGGYTNSARIFARENNIRLYSITSTGRLSRVGRGPVVGGRTLDRVALATIAAAIVLAALSWAIANPGKTATALVIVIAVIAAVTVLIVLNFVIEFFAPTKRS